MDRDQPQDELPQHVPTKNGRTRPELREEIRWRSGHHPYLCEFLFMRRGRALGIAGYLVLILRLRAVRFVLCCDIGVYHRDTIGTHAGLRANEQHVARNAPQRYHRIPPCQFCNLHTPMVGPRSSCRPGPMHSLCGLVRCPPGVVLGHAWEAMD